MKSFSIVFSVIILLFACKSPEEFREKDPVYHQLVDEAEARDSAMLELVTTINLIDESLGQISQKEDQLRLNANDPEFTENNRDNILNEIQSIYEMMEENKNKVNELNRRLAEAREKIKQSDADLKHANKLMAQYQVMIDKLNTKIEVRDTQIASLEEELAKMNISLDSLKMEFSEQKEDLNRVYFAFGTKKELMEKNVIDKSGGFIGIGKTLQLKSDFNKSFFTEASLSELKEIELYVEEANMLTTHRDGSYHFDKKEDRIEKLVIDDAQKFWESSKYLVLEVEQ